MSYQLIRKTFARFSARSQRKRAEILTSRIGIATGARIVDLGGNDGRQIARLFPEWDNVTICDLSEAALAKARARGFDTIQADATSGVPVPDNHFDFCFCSSVIEHVTGPKSDMRSMTDGGAFKRTAIANQLAFAAEIRRISKSYFVQTPHPLFPIESHTWLPAIILLLPRARLLALTRFTNRFWPKKASPDWNLLTAKDMARMFPDAEIVIERFCGLPKSIIALRGPASEAKFKCKPILHRATAIKQSERDGVQAGRSSTDLALSGTSFRATVAALGVAIPITVGAAILSYLFFKEPRGRCTHRRSADFV